MGTADDTDYPPPPHVRSTSPLTTSPSIAQRSLTRQLRDAADDFRRLEDERSAVEHERAAASLMTIGQTGVALTRQNALHELVLNRVRRCEDEEYKLLERCGKVLIDAHAKGLIPAELREHAEVIAHHRQPLRPWPEGFKGVRVPPHPANLFGDVCGGHWFRIVQDGDGRFRSGAEFGGLMPCWDAFHLELTKFGRYAATCEFLADLFELDIPVAVRGGLSAPPPQLERGLLPGDRIRSPHPLAGSTSELPDGFFDVTKFPLPWHHG